MLTASPHQEVAVRTLALSRSFGRLAAVDAIYPVELMPSWLRLVATVNPLTYLVDSMRSLMLGGPFDSHNILLDFGVMGALLLVLIVMAGRLYPSLAL